MSYHRSGNVYANGAPVGNAFGTPRGMGASSPAPGVVGYGTSAGYQGAAYYQSQPTGVRVVQQPTVMAPPMAVRTVHSPPRLRVIGTERRSRGVMRVDRGVRSVSPVGIGLGHSHVANSYYLPPEEPTVVHGLGQTFGGAQYGSFYQGDVLPSPMGGTVASMSTIVPPTMTPVSSGITTPMSSARGAPMPVGRTNDFGGKRRALIVGCNYEKSSEKLRLAGCQNDAACMQKFLELQGWPSGKQNMRTLTDRKGGSDSKQPTKRNIMDGIRWLVEGARAGDTLFFSFSGHGKQQKDLSGDEADGLDEVLVTSDEQFIDDDTLFEELVQKLPTGSHLTAIIDCCHSGTILDLPYNFESFPPSGIKLETDNKAIQRGSRSAGQGQAVVFSACADNQVAGDVQNAVAGGACTNALLSHLFQTGPMVSYADILTGIHDRLRERGLGQAPRMSTAIPLDAYDIFSLSADGQATEPFPRLPRGRGDGQYLNPLLGILEQEGKVSVVKNPGGGVKSRGWGDFMGGGDGGGGGGGFGQFADMAGDMLGGDNNGGGGGGGFGQMANMAQGFMGGGGEGGFGGMADMAQGFLGGEGGMPGIPSMEEIGNAIKEALREALQGATSQASSPGGFLQNAAIAIPWPEQVQSVRDALANVGMDAQCDDMVRNMNQAAEGASGDAFGVFGDALGEMSVGDARGVLDGGDTAATEYFRGATSGELTDLFSPIVNRAMESCAVTAYWDDLINAYNRIPFVPDIDFDLVRYVVEKALAGLFTLVSDFEAKFRADPAASVSGLVQKVFKWKLDGCPE